MSKTAARTEIEQIGATFVRNANAKNVDALVKEFYANDACLLPPGAAMIRGIDGIRAFWKGMIESGASDVSLETQTVESSGEMAYEIGSANFSMPDGKGGKNPVSGKYMVVFKRQADGTLRAVADIFNMNV